MQPWCEPILSRRRVLLGLAALATAMPARAGRRWRRRSPYNRVEVEVRPDGIVELRLDGARQSAWDPAHPERLLYGYSAVMVAGLERTPLVQTGTGRALVIGLGGGTLCRWLRRRCPGVEVHAIELDPVVVEAARRFFDLDPAVAVHVGDGRAFLDADPGPWDLVVLDAASEDYVPPSLQTVQCLQRVAAVLSGRGVVLANAWRGAPSAADEAATWRHVFPDVTERHAPAPEENRVFAAGPGWSPGPDDLQGTAGGAVLHDPSPSVDDAPRARQ